MLKNMNNTKIHFLSGPVHSGKTSKLSKWVKKTPNADGILSPVIDGKRFIKHISSGHIKRLDISKPHPDSDIINVGTNAFSRKTFLWAEKVLLSCFTKKLDWCIIDEIGHLEIKGKGLDKAVTTLFYSDHLPINNIVLVVRSNLIDNVINHYGLVKREINFLDLNNL